MAHFIQVLNLGVVVPIYVTPFMEQIMIVKFIFTFGLIDPCVNVDFLMHDCGITFNYCQTHSKKAF